MEWLRAAMFAGVFIVCYKLHAPLWTGRFATQKCALQVYEH